MFGEEESRELRKEKREVGRKLKERKKEGREAREKGGGKGFISITEIWWTKCCHLLVKTTSHKFELRDSSVCTINLYFLKRQLRVKKKE